MVAIADEVDGADLDQLDGGHGSAAQAGAGDAQPTTAGLFTKWVEGRIEIGAAALRSQDGGDRDSLDTGIMAAAHDQGGQDFIQVEQAGGAAGEAGEPAGCSAFTQSCLVETYRPARLQVIGVCSVRAILVQSGFDRVSVKHGCYLSGDFLSLSLV